MEAEKTILRHLWHLKNELENATSEVNNARQAVEENELELFRASCFSAMSTAYHILISLDKAMEAQADAARLEIVKENMKYRD